MQESERSVTPKNNRIGRQDLHGWRFLLLATLSLPLLICWNFGYFKIYAESPGLAQILFALLEAFFTMILGLTFYGTGLISLAFKSYPWRNAFWATGSFAMLVNGSCLVIFAIFF